MQSPPLPRDTWRFPCIVLALTSVLSMTGPTHGQDLPSKMQVPEGLRTRTLQPGDQAVTPPTVAVPEPKPATKPVETGQKAAPGSDPALPDPRPAVPGSATPDKTATPAPSSSPANQLPSADELACRTRLKLLGAVFKEAEPVHDPAGCEMPHPIEMSRMTDTIDIAPGVVLNCTTAETAARFMRDIASPAAKAEFGAEVKSIAQASGFVCRPRNGTTKLSEHAFGNALDIASFTLTNGTVVAVEPAPPPKSEKFLHAVRAAACGPFKTVLGPGSNADHALHFHFDLAPRRNGGTYCK